MKKLLMILTAIIAISASAGTMVDTSGLSEEQKAQVQISIEQMKKNQNSPQNISEQVRTEAQAWGDMGANVAKGVVGAAKELGVAANDFASTPLGKIVTFILVYKVIGSSALGLAYGLIVLVLGIILTVYLITTDGWYDVKYETITRFKGLWVSKHAINREISVEMQAIRLISIGVTIGLTLAISSHCIF